MRVTARSGLIGSNRAMLVDKQTDLSLKDSNKTLDSSLATSDGKTPRAIIFFGSDGTGKTTQANILVGKLRGRGIRTKKTWIRGRHTLAFVVSKVLQKLNQERPMVPDRYHLWFLLDTNETIRTRVWSLLEFVSVVPLVVYRMYVPLLLGYRVVAERYVVDTVIFNQYYIGHSFDPYGRILMRMVPKNSLLIHLDGLERDILKRRSEDGTPLAFVEYQLKTYRSLASTLHALTINTSLNDIAATAGVVETACSLKEISNDA
jgi:thymidylate kinase